ncbi:ATP-binding cassette domain-containing protein [bacterium]|nr:ATP-binding cassette domain-containing protein [FCB group bacterium]MBL7191095.1 ATP-binding cassette domain-containing protein [bacterium]
MISLKKVKYSYSGRLAVEDVSIHFASDERAAVMGANGSGKSTLALLIKGLLTPDEGNILIDGLPTGEINPGKIGFVFQNPENQLVGATVEREIAFGLENAGMERRKMIKRVDEILEQFGLERYRKHPPHKLSGGQKQMLALAAVMVLQPQWLILDEPSSLLDSAAKSDFLHLIFNIHPKTGIIFITQDALEASVFPRLIIMNQGRIFYDGGFDSFFKEHDALNQAGIEPPVRFALEQRLAV